MIGLDYYDERNRVTLSLPVQTFKSENQGTTNYGTGRLWKLTRNRQLQYKFTGLSFETAQKCIADKTALYTRDYGTWVLRGSTWRYMTDVSRRYKSTVAQISCARMAENCELWEITIGVDEECIGYTQIDAGAITSYDAWFRNCFGEWEYDGYVFLA